MGIFLRLAGLSFCLLPMLVRADPGRVLEDVPGRLVLEVEVGEATLRPVSGQGQRVTCPDCQDRMLPGAPDLPVYRFDVLSGPVPPQVTVHILQSETRTVPALAPFPASPTPRRVSYRADPALYQSASQLSPRLLGLRQLRGAPMRGVEVPLALWAEGTHTLTLIRKLRVELAFPGVLPRPSANRLQAPFARTVKNPVGGAYLYAWKATVLRKEGARSRLGKSFIKIKVGDKQLDTFEEDKVYEVPFEALSALDAQVRATNLDYLRLFTGRDTLEWKMEAPPVKTNLREIPLEVLDRDGDGTFDEGDALRFYGHGTSQWNRIAGNMGPIRYEFSADPYSFENYYYLDYGGTEEGLRLPAESGGAAMPSPRASSYAYVRAEKDNQTAACDPSNVKDEETGLVWFWFWRGRCDSYNDSDLTLSGRDLITPETATLTDWDGADPARDTLYLGLYLYPARMENVFSVYYAGASMPHFRAHAARGDYYARAGSWPNAPAFRLDSVIWRGTEKRFEGYTVSYRRRHVYSGKPLWIFPSEFGKRVSYQVQGGSNLTCLRVEKGVAVKSLALQGGLFTDSLDAAADARYLVYGQVAALPEGGLSREGLPVLGTALQNLETADIGRDNPGEQAPDYLIISPRALLEQALALRDFRRGTDRALSLNTDVVLVEDIYREYSGGRMSPIAIRDFLRWAYYSWGGKPAGSNPLKYVALFGDGHYDYRGIKTSVRTNPPPNHLPPFEYLTGEGRENVAIEDFFGNLDAGESNLDSAALDLAIGRIPVQTPQEAADYVAKARAYDNVANAGEWRGRVLLAADDATQRGNPPNNLDPIRQGHTTDSDSLGQIMLGHEPGLNMDKVYLLDYPMNTSFRKPEAQQDLISRINRGVVNVNYVGHGSDNQWADEVLLQTSDGLTRMRNAGRTPMINAFSCTVGRFESLKSEGMSEQMVKQPAAGAIGAISATRESFPIPNLNLARAYYSRVFPPDTSDLMVTVGDALRDAKNSSETLYDNLNDAKYSLLGEPVILMRKRPLHPVLTESMDTIRALACGKLRGRIEGGSGNGFANVKIVAGSSVKIYELPPGMDAQKAVKRGNILFERTIAYRNHEFSTDYFIPRQISFGDSNAQIQVYAWDGAREMEGSVAKRNISILGTAQSGCPGASDDGVGPRIRISGCEKKETGDLDFPEQVRLSLPYCLQVHVADSLGGVLSAEGPDEGTTVEIPGALEPFHPQPGLDELFQKTYQVTLGKKDLRPGQHLFKVSARDGYGNYSWRQLRLEVVEDSSLNTVTAFNAPNPMKRGGTRFFFSTVLPAGEVEVGGPLIERVSFEIRIFDQRGRLVRGFREAESGVTSWDGRDEWGNRLANGVYFYQVVAKQNLEEKVDSYRTVSSKRNVLVISR